MLATQDVRPPTGAELGQELVRLGQERDLIDLRFSLVAAEFAKTDECDQQGYVSPIDGIGFFCHMTSNGAAERVAVGDRIGELPQSMDLMVSGRSGVDHM